jgi:hypothetical protein
MPWRARGLGVALVVLLAACGTSPQIQELADRFGCTSVEETGKVDMQGTGLAAFCDGLPGGTSLIFHFGSESDRDRFFADIWPDTEFVGSFVLVGSDWAVASDASTISAAAALRDRVGGVPLTSLDL